MFLLTTGKAWRGVEGRGSKQCGEDAETWMSEGLQRLRTEGSVLKPDELLQMDIDLLSLLLYCVSE